MFVLDTNVCIDLGRGDTATAELLEALEGRAPLAVTAITVHELVQGAYRAERVERELSIIRRMLQAFDVLEYNGAAGWIAGRLAAQLLKQGRPIGDLDTMIAATTMAHSAQLVTRNMKHFERVEGLVLHPVDPV